jgi:hypothetical protein
MVTRAREHRARAVRDDQLVRQVREERAANEAGHEHTVSEGAEFAEFDAR